VNGAGKAGKYGSFTKEGLFNIFPSQAHSKFDIAFQYHVRREI
jgi:hypothetical protein